MDDERAPIATTVPKPGLPGGSADGAAPARGPPAFTGAAAALPTDRPPAYYDKPAKRRWYKARPQCKPPRGLFKS